MTVTSSSDHAASVRSNPPISNKLILVLRFAKYVMGAVTILLILAAIVFLFSNPLRNWLLSGADFSAISNTRSVALASFTSAVIGAAWFLVLDKLIRVVRTIQDGDPFVEDNIGRMRGMWILIACAEVFRMIAIFAVGFLAGDTGGDAATMRVDIRIGTWFLVFVIAALSEAFRMGVELRRDQELTI